MKYVRWVLFLSLLVCSCKVLVERPFFKELPMLLLPEPNSDMFMERSNYSAYDDVLDPRPICIQTKNNFSCFSLKNQTDESYIISRLKSHLFINGTNLLDDKIIATPPKDFSPEVTPVWATKRTSPVHVVEQKAPKLRFIPR